jgi:hypothetical protein
VLSIVVSSGCESWFLICFDFCHDKSGLLFMQCEFFLFLYRNMEIYLAGDMDVDGLFYGRSYVYSDCNGFWGGVTKE